MNEDIIAIVAILGVIVGFSALFITMTLVMGDNSPDNFRACVESGLEYIDGNCLR